MKALIDADIFCYEFGNMTDLETGGLLPWEITRSLVDKRIAAILEAVEADSAVYYLTDSKSNFRNEVATILPYKGHRTADKPPHWTNIRQHLIDNYDAEVQYGIEADDACGIEQCKLYKDQLGEQFGLHRYMFDGTEDIEADGVPIICSRDKDMDMIPGWHYSWECGKQKEKKWFVSELDGIKSFYKQLLTGDSTDNILGLFGVGKAAACVKRIDTYEHEVDMFKECYARYYERFGAHWYDMMIENAQLLWILRQSTDPLYITEVGDEVVGRLEDMLGQAEAQNV